LELWSNGDLYGDVLDEQVANVDEQVANGEV